MNTNINSYQKKSDTMYRVDISFSFYLLNLYNYLKIGMLCLFLFLVYPIILMIAIYFIQIIIKFLLTSLQIFPFCVQINSI